MNYRVLVLVGLLAVSFVGAVIWKMNHFIVSERTSWAQAQLRTQIASLQNQIDSNIQNIYRLGPIFQEGKRDKNFWRAVAPFKAIAWIRDLKTPTLENINVKDGAGLDDTTLASSVKALQGLKPENQKILFVPWKDGKQNNWFIVVWPWSENRQLVLWTDDELFQGALAQQKGGLSQLTIANQAGQVLAHDEREYFGTRVDDHPLFEIFKNEGVTQGSSLYTDQAGQKFFGHLATISRANIIVFASASESELFADKNKTAAFYLLLGLGFVLLTMGGLAYIAKSEEHPALSSVVPPKPVSALGPEISKPTFEDKHKVYKSIAASVGHELRGPMARILGFCQMILSQGASPQTQDHTESILRETREAREILDKLSHFAQESHVPVSEDRLSNLLNNVVARMKTMLDRKNVRVEIDMTETPIFSVAGPLLESAFENILENSIEAMEGRQNKEIKITATVTPEGTQFIFEDNGEGIDQQDLPKVFDPFFTTKAHDRHIGLGLSSVYGAIHQHQGDIRVESEKGKGTKVILTFPENAQALVSSPVKTVLSPQSDLHSFSPADVEIEKLMDMRDEQVVKPISKKPSQASPIIVQPQLPEDHFFIEKTVSELDEVKVQIRRPRSHVTGITE